jgi:hypothetical protein
MFQKDLIKVERLRIALLLSACDDIVELILFFAGTLGVRAFSNM